MYNSRKVCCCKNLNRELYDIIEKSGYKDTFTKKYFDSLRFLENLMKNCIMQSKLFEKLKGTDYDIFSITLHGTKNIRILFVFKTICSEEYALLLTAFEEKNSSDYKSGISKAIKIINEINKG